MDFLYTIRTLYAAFNRRDIDAVMLYLSEDVKWPNGWEGGHVYGHEGVRNYWTRQWKEIDPEVEPIDIQVLSDGRIEVLVQQNLRDMSGKLIMKGEIKHIYTFENDKITTMEIAEAG